MITFFGALAAVWIAGGADTGSKAAAERAAIGHSRVNAIAKIAMARLLLRTNVAFVLTVLFAASR
ncbi:MAG: hypothetical protein WB780_23955 [Candidatus Acidiferrales bacterium]